MKTLAQRRARICHASARFALFAHMQQAAQKCPGGNHNALGGNSETEIGLHSDRLSRVC